MAGLSKDVQLIFRGEDRVSPTIKGVHKAVSDLTAAIREQLEAAERGEGSIDKLAEALKGLDAVKGDVQEITKLAAAYEKLTGNLAEQTAKVDAAKQKEAALAAEIANTVKPLKSKQNALDAAQRSVAAAIQKEESLKTAVASLGSVLEAAGGDANNFAATQDRIKAAALEAARAIRDAGGAMDQFKGKQATGRGAADEAAQFGSLAAGSGLPQAQINFISGLENRLEALKAAIAEDQASMARFNAELRDNAASEAAQRIRQIAGAFNEAEQAQERLKVTSGFRQIAAEAQAGARDISRFGPTLESTAVSARRLTDAIQSIIAPTNAAAATMEGINGIIAQSESVLDGSKRRLSEYNAEINNLSTALAGIQGIARLIDDFHRQDAAVVRARTSMREAQGEVLRLSEALRTAETPTQEMANALKVAEANLENAGRAFQSESGKLNVLSLKLREAKVDVFNLAAAEEQLTTAATRAASAQGAIAGKTSGKGAFLGLNPFELQNLGYQINDIVTGLISGQKPFTVFAQQGLQIGQILPGAFSKIVGYLPELAAVGATLFTVGSAMEHTSQAASNLKLGQGIATQVGDTQAAAGAYGDLAKKLEDMGVKADKARELLVQLSADGFDPSTMSQYVDTAIAVSKVTGEDIPAAMEQLRAAFGGGIEQIIDLDDKTNAYTDSEMAMIEQLYEEGKADEARATALAIYQQKMQEVADNQEGGWSRAGKNLKLVWDNFLDTLRFIIPEIDVAADALRNMGNMAAYALGRMAGIPAAQAAFGGMAGVQGQGTNTNTMRLPAARPSGPPAPTNAGRLIAQQDADSLRLAKARTDAEKKLAGSLKARHEAEREGARLGLNDVELAQHVAAKVGEVEAKADQTAEKHDAAAARREAAAQRRREAAAKAAQRHAEAIAKALANEQESLVRGIEGLDSEVDKNTKQSLDKQLDAIREKYAKLLRALDEFSKKTGGKGKVGDLTIPEARQHILDQEAQLENYKSIEFAEKGVNDLEKERQSRLSDIADQVARGIIKPEDGLNQSYGVIDDMATKITTMAQQGLAVAQALNSIHPSPELSKIISGFQTAIQNNSGGQNARAKTDTTKQFVATAEQGLNDLISERNNLIERQNSLHEEGYQAQGQTEQNIAGIYTTTNDLIQQQIDKVRALAAAFANSADPATQLYYRNLIANLDKVQGHMEYIPDRMKQMRVAMQQVISSGIISFIDTLAQSFAKLATGQEGVMGFLADVGRAFLKMVADILAGIAKLIIEAIVIDVVEKVTGVPIKEMLKVFGAVRHDGGLANSSGRQRAVSPLVFANAPHYHTGGIAGLKPDEVGAILKRNEEVLTTDDPRHRMNGGLAGGKDSGASSMTRAVLAVGDEEVASAMQGEAGERVVMYHLRRNRSTVRQWVGG